MKKDMKLQTTSFSLHLIAMFTMLCDHLWGTIVPGNDWLTCIGRISFPIFAFMIVEGYFHTKNLKKYVLRLFIFALISEIPFNLAVGSRLFYPIHQNVLWSFLISIGLIHLNEKAKKSNKTTRRVLIGLFSIIIGYIIGIISMVDYFHGGILTVLVFYFFRDKKWWCYLVQFICLWYINTEILGGFGYEIQIGANTYFFLRQSLALLALIPIWLYKGEQGYHSKTLQLIYYAFYPVHLLILGLFKFI